MALNDEKLAIIKAELQASNKEYEALSGVIKESVDELKVLKKKLEKVADNFDKAGGQSVSRDREGARLCGPIRRLNRSSTKGSDL